MTVNGLDTNTTYQVRAFVLPDTSGADYQYGNTATWTTDTGVTGCDDDAELFSGGSGLSTDPFRLCTSNDMKEFDERRDYKGAEYKLLNDIDMEFAGEFGPVGTGDATFDGGFDGAGYTISNLNVDQGSTSDVGMFARIGSKGTVTDITFEGADILGGDRTGTVTGQNNGMIQRVQVRDATVEGDDRTGALAGRNNGLIEDSSATGTIDNVGSLSGGFVGRHNDGSIVRSYADVDVTNTSSNQIGGFVGRSESLIETSYATGSVDGTDISEVGGFVGRNDSTINNSYASGAVSENDSTGSIGGFVANNNDTVSDSYWDTDTSNQSGSDAGSPLTTSEFGNDNNFPGWDFSSIWNIGTAPDGESRPVLQ